MKQTFHSNGKLLLTGEYVVLEGATALALPTRFGQSLEVESIDEPLIKWHSYDPQGKIWFQEHFSLEGGKFTPILMNSPSVTERLLQLFRTVIELKPEFFNQRKGYAVTTKLEFPNIWGLGSSSTLINNIAQWTDTDPYKLLQNSFGGSGYDIAAAQTDSPFLFTLNDGAQIQKCKLQWNFKESLFLVHLNKKRDSRKAIDQFQSVKKNTSKTISNITAITLAISKCQSLDDFLELIDRHEQLISNVLHQSPIKEALFKDYTGSVKSLGAWGGDFVLVTADDDGLDYFKKKGYTTIIPFNDMVK